MDYNRFALPWRLKLAAKLVLSRLPLPHQFWKKLRLFEMGAMQDPSYAYRTFRAHFDAAWRDSWKDGFTVLELGPGESLFTALIAHALGARTTYLVDTGAWASFDVSLYARCSAFLRQAGLPAASLEDVAGMEDVLQRCHGQYLTQGLNSLSELPDASVDLIFSQAVLEHVRKREFGPVMRELRRLLRPGGLCSHQVDLKDHFNGGLNNLRFGESWWESEPIARAGFYTNRIRHQEMMRLFEASGFRVVGCRMRRFETPPLARKHLAPEFRHLSDTDLEISSFDVLLAGDGDPAASAPAQASPR